MLQVIRDLGPRAELIDIMDASKCGHVQAHHPSIIGIRKSAQTHSSTVSHVRAVDGRQQKSADPRILNSTMVKMRTARNEFTLAAQHKSKQATLQHYTCNLWMSQNNKQEWPQTISVLQTYH